MPTANPRLNITLEPQLAAILAQLAKREDKSVAAMARELVVEALDRREDMALSKIAERRDTGKSKTIPHADAWK